MPPSGMKGVWMGRPSPYSSEFRDDALRLVRTDGLSVNRVARDLGLSPQTLRNWLKQSDVDAGKAEGLTTAEREELRRLRRENRVLQQEREILKKAAAWFAKETGSTP